MASLHWRMQTHSLTNIILTQEVKQISSRYVFLYPSLSLSRDDKKGGVTQQQEAEKISSTISTILTTKTEQHHHHHRRSRQN